MGSTTLERCPGCDTQLPLNIRLERCLTCGQALKADPNADTERATTVALESTDAASENLRQFQEMATMAEEGGSEHPIAFAPTIASGASGTLPTSLRRYQDGLVTNDRGETVASQEIDGAVALPYASKEVQRRIGGYDILEQVGAGAMGIVYRGYSVRLCRAVAIKVITPGDRASASAIARFHNEAILAARLSHTNIVSIFDSGVEDGLHYFIMEYIDGEPLGDLIADLSDSLADTQERSSDFGVDELVTITAKVARALHYAHQQGVLHRDIKPDNILVDQAGEPHIADFGLATEKPKNPDPNAPGGILGTPAYMPPEQANGELHHLGPHSDVWSLGATLYHALAGRPPFSGKSIVSILSAVLNAEPESVSDLAAERGLEVPLDLETIVLKCLEKQASRRYASAAELASDLEAFQRGEPISARPIGGLERLQKLVMRNRQALVGAVVVFSVLLTLVMGFGAVTLANVEASSDALKKKDVADALRQAETVERAIRVNMLQGRADQARELIKELGASDDGSLEVVRRDRSIAYTDRSTRAAVESRLNNEKVLDWIDAAHPGFRPKVEELKRLGFPTIKRQETEDKGFVDISAQKWMQALQTFEPTTWVEEGPNPTLVVVRPIENTAECLICHGNAPFDNLSGGSSEEGGAGYAGEVASFGGAVDLDQMNRVRAVLVMRRSQRELRETIAANNRTTLLIGVGTALAFLALALVFTKVLGIGLSRRQFGVRQR